MHGKQNLLIRACAFAFMLVLLSVDWLHGSVLPTDWLFYSAVHNSTETQGLFISGPPSLPFGNSHTAVLGPSTSTTNYVFQQGANYVDYLITMQHNCVQQTDNGTRCESTGSIDFTPRTDVLVTIDGFYNYNMTTDPMTAGGGARIYRTSSSPWTILFATGGSASTSFNPHAGTIPLSASGIVPAGFHYELFYTSQLAFLGGANVTATANGQIHFRVTEVPEPAALGLLAFSSLLVLRQRRRSRSS